MINIACDKSLFTAHRLNLRHITGEIAKTAILDLAGRSGWRRFGFPNQHRIALAAGGCCLLLILVMVTFFSWEPDRQAVALKAEVKEVKPAVVNQTKTPKVIPLPEKAPEPPAKKKPASMPELPNAEEPAITPPVMAASNPAPEKRPEMPAKMTYSVQVGAFRARIKAEKLVGTLKQKGYPAAILPVTDSRKRTWYTVRIGDHASRQAAILHANEFSAREKMESAVRPFERL
jgi:hypothetical protein